MEYILPGQKVLDLGCGNGRLFKILKNKNVKYVGVDNSEKLLLEAQKQYSEDKEKF
jgi:cyclopropane fatty-acyl-phospholipid synthase-like methyltransferase